MTYLATATIIAGAFPVDEAGNMLRHSHNPKAEGASQLPEEREFIQGCKGKAKLAKIEDIRDARQATITIMGGRKYRDDEITTLFGNAEGVFHHLKNRGVLVEAKGRGDQMEAAPSMSKGSTQVTEGNMDGNGNLVAPRLDDIADSDDF